VAACTVTILPSALRQLAGLARRDQQKVKERIDRLAADPRPPGARRLKGELDLFRVRCGNYRIIYSVEDVQLVVLVVRIGHRRDIYRAL
jgi:mRNA interferase RelE/StbE